LDERTLKKRRFVSDKNPFSKQQTRLIRKLIENPFDQFKNRGSNPRFGAPNDSGLIHSYSVN